MPEESFMNARGETVVPLHVFKQMSPRAVEQSVAKPYPRHSRERCNECGCFVNGRHAKGCKSA